jgi:hypothetical protein
LLISLVSKLRNCFVIEATNVVVFRSNFFLSWSKYLLFTLVNSHLYKLVFYWVVLAIPNSHSVVKKHDTFPFNSYSLTKSVIDHKSFMNFFRWNNIFRSKTYHKNGGRFFSISSLTFLRLGKIKLELFRTTFLR